MPRISAGLVMYRVQEGKLEFLLVHPGGPFWQKKDAGACETERGSRKTLDRKIGDRKMETKFVQDQTQILAETSETLPIFLSPIFLSKIFAKMTDFYLYYPARRAVVLLGV